MKSMLVKFIALFIIMVSCTSSGDKHIEVPDNSNTGLKASVPIEKVEITDTEIPDETPNATETSSGKVIHINAAEFKEKVFDYTNAEEYVFAGDKPCIIDFYADWCRPCKILAPTLDKLAKKYEGKINIYKVNTEQERELAGAFQIRSIPSLLFCPKNGQPQMAMGVLPQEKLEEVINTFLLNQSK